MKQIVFVAVDDADVDLLSRIRQRDDMCVEAVYHPNPDSLVARIAALSRLPVISDRERLEGMTPDVCIGGEQAAELAAELRERALLAGRPAPVFVPMHRVTEYLDDVPGFMARLHDESFLPEPSDFEVTSVAPPRARVPAADEPARTVVEGKVPLDPDAAAREAAARAIEAKVEEALNARRAHPRPEAPVAPPPVAPPPAPALPSPTLGTPPIDVCYEPARLVAWLTEAAARVLGGSAAVVWQREAGGDRYTLLGYAPGTLALPALPTPPRLLEELTRSGHPQVVPSSRLFAGAEMLVPLSLVAVPLTGQSGLFGLLGVFRPDTHGPLAPAALTELARRAPEFGQALERCYRFTEMGQELQRLRFRDRLRDFMLNERLSAPGRWKEFLALVLEATPAAAAYLYRFDALTNRLELTAVDGDDEMPAGRLSVPVGRGFIGSAFQRDVITVYSRDDLDDAADAHDLYLTPLRARRNGVDTPVALLVLDGVAAHTPTGQETTGFLEELAGIALPFLE